MFYTLYLCQLGYSYSDVSHFAKLKGDPAMIILLWTLYISSESHMKEAVYLLGMSSVCCSAIIKVSLFLIYYLASHSLYLPLDNTQIFEPTSPRPKAQGPRPFDLSISICLTWQLWHLTLIHLLSLIIHIWLELRRNPMRPIGCLLGHYLVVPNTVSQW